MKKKMYFIPLAACALFMASCGNKSQNSTEETHKDSVEVAEIASIHGIYKGTLPAADCPGIETTLALNSDKTFALNSLYIDRGEDAFNEQGNYGVEDSILTLVTANDSPQYYKVEKDQLRMLNMDKELITGPLAENYVLKKVDE